MQNLVQHKIAAQKNMNLIEIYKDVTFQKWC